MHDSTTMNSEIEWNRIRGIRNRISHDYFGNDHEIVWTIIENDLENLIEQIKTVISNSWPEFNFNKPQAQI